MEKEFEEIKKVFKSYRKKYDDLNVNVEYNTEVWASGLYFNLYPFQVELSNDGHGCLYKRIPHNYRNKTRFLFHNNKIVKVEVYNGFGEISLEYYIKYNNTETIVLGFYDTVFDRCFMTKYDGDKIPISTICLHKKPHEDMLRAFLYECSDGRVSCVVEKGFITHNNETPAIIDVKYDFLYNEFNELTEITGEIINHKNGSIAKEIVYKRKE